MRQINIQVEAQAGNGRTSMAWLLADFLQFSGFKVELNDTTLNPDNADLTDLIASIPDNLAAIKEDGVTIVINSVQSNGNV